MKIENVQVFGLERVFKTAKFPKCAGGTEKLNNDLTDGIRACLTCHTGQGHDNALKGIVVMFDLTFSIKAWTEAERYHFFDIVSSQSTMHKITEMDIAEHCSPYVTWQAKSMVRGLVDEYKRFPTAENYLRVLYNVPVGLELTAGMVTNYQQLKTIYQQRKTHRLPEWREFCGWVETLPYSELITGRNDEGRRKQKSDMPGENGHQSV